jgi:hypothetical protein
MTNLEAIRKASGLGADVELVGPDESVVVFHMNPLPTIKLADLTDIFSKNADDTGKTISMKFLQKDNMNQIFGLIKFSVENSLSDAEKKMITPDELDKFVSSNFKELFDGVKEANGIGKGKKEDEEEDEKK